MERLLLVIFSWLVITCTSQKTNKALVIIDVQICFTKGGTLEVAQGDQVIPVINKLRQEYDQYFDLVVFSQDWHCPDHVSFYTQYRGHQVYGSIPLYYTNNGDLCLTDVVTSKYAVNCTGNTTKLDQTLWPPHCVINTTDADLHSSMIQKSSDIIVRKGYNCQLDSYSVFFDNGDFKETEMNDVLQKYKIDTVFITGLARDYCVFWTAKDALRLGYITYVIEDATRPVANDSGVIAIREMKAKGINVIQSSEMKQILAISKASSTLSTLNFIFCIAGLLLVIEL